MRPDILLGWMFNRMVTTHAQQKQDEREAIVKAYTQCIRQLWTLNNYTPEDPSQRDKHSTVKKFTESRCNHLLDEISKIGRKP